MLPEALIGGANHRSHWKWGMESLSALHHKVTFSPSITVTFPICRMIGLARTRSEMKIVKGCNQIIAFVGWFFTYFILLTTFFRKPSTYLLRLHYS